MRQASKTAGSGCVADWGVGVTTEDSFEEKIPDSQFRILAAMSAIPIGTKTMGDAAEVQQTISPHMPITPAHANDPNPPHL